MDQKAVVGNENEWKVRPGGMLVQKRDPDGETNRVPPPTIGVRVKYGSVYHEINISSQASFGVKERSKMVVMDDPISQEKRFLEMRKNVILALKSIGLLVSAIESIISKGGKVAEKTLLNVTELLMNQLLKLDGLTVDGDAKMLRKTQVKRIQEYVETVDALKLKNSTTSSIGGTQPQSKSTVVAEKPQPPPSQVVETTTEWEIFDSLAAQTSKAATSNTMNSMFNWDLI